MDPHRPTPPPPAPTSSLRLLSPLPWLTGRLMLPCWRNSRYNWIFNPHTDDPTTYTTLAFYILGIDNTCQFVTTYCNILKLITSMRLVSLVLFCYYYFFVFMFTRISYTFCLVTMCNYICFSVLLTAFLLNSIYLFLQYRKLSCEYYSMQQDMVSWVCKYV